MAEEPARLVAGREIGVASFFDLPGDPFHRPVERLCLPLVGVRGAIEHLRDAVRVDGELESVRPFRTQSPLVDRTAGIALNVNELTALGVDELTAADGAVRA